MPHYWARSTHTTSWNMFNLHALSHSAKYIHFTKGWNWLTLHAPSLWAKSTHIIRKRPNYKGAVFCTWITDLAQLLSEHRISGCRCYIKPWLEELYCMLNTVTATTPMSKCTATARTITQLVYLGRQSATSLGPSLALVSATWVPGWRSLWSLAPQGSGKMKCISICWHLLEMERS